MTPTDTPTIDIGDPLVIVRCPDGSTVESTGYPPSPCPTVPPNPEVPTRTTDQPTCLTLDLTTGYCGPVADTGAPAGPLAAAALTAALVGIALVRYGRRR